MSTGNNRLGVLQRGPPQISTNPTIRPTGIQAALTLTQIIQHTGRTVPALPQHGLLIPKPFKFTQAFWNHELEKKTEMNENNEKAISPV